MKLAATLIALTIALQGCVTDDGLTGTGPVKLTTSQQSSFEKWASGGTGRDALYFFLVRGGSSYWVHCPNTAAMCREDREENWKQKCDDRYGHGACKLYGVFGDVVWRFGEPADPNWWNVTKTGAPGNPLVFDVRWDGRPTTLKGYMIYRSNLGRYSFDVVLLEKTVCEGVANTRSGSRWWQLSCDGGLNADGTFRPSSVQTSLVGVGKDSKGNRIEFRVSPPSS